MLRLSYLLTKNVPFLTKASRINIVHWYKIYTRLLAKSNIRHWQILFTLTECEAESFKQEKQDKQLLIWDGARASRGCQLISENSKHLNSQSFQINMLFGSSAIFVRGWGGEGQHFGPGFNQKKSTTCFSPSSTVKHQ